MSWFVEVKVADKTRPQELWDAVPSGPDTPDTKTDCAAAKEAAHNLMMRLPFKEPLRVKLNGHDPAQGYPKRTVSLTIDETD